MTPRDKKIQSHKVKLSIKILMNYSPTNINYELGIKDYCETKARSLECLVILLDNLNTLTGRHIVWYVWLIGKYLQKDLLRHKSIRSWNFSVINMQTDLGTIQYFDKNFTFRIFTSRFCNYLLSPVIQKRQLNRKLN